MKHGRSSAGAILALTLLGGGGVCWAITRGAPPPAPVARALPDLTLDAPTLRGVTRIEITQPEPIDDEVPARSITLERQDGGWEITSPIRTRASAPKVDALLENLASVDVVERRDGGARADEEARLDGRAVHVVLAGAAGPMRDVYFGKTDEHGQWMRVAGRDDVLILANSGPRGYSGFLFTRGLRSWREPAILAFDEADAIEVEITNPNGRFDFVRDGAAWSATRAPRGRDGTLGDGRAWPAFDGSKVDALLHAYRGLAADDYGAEGERAGSGVDDAERTGGTVRIRSKSGLERTVHVGKRSTRTGRWAIEGSRWAVLDGGDGTLYVLAPWTADWATADSKAFEGGAH
jgi:hypothetical protein